MDPDALTLANQSALHLPVPDEAFDLGTADHAGEGSTLFAAVGQGAFHVRQGIEPRDQPGAEGVVGGAGDAGKGPGRALRLLRRHGAERPRRLRPQLAPVQLQRDLAQPLALPAEQGPAYEAKFEELLGRKPARIGEIVDGPVGTIFIR